MKPFLAFSAIALLATACASTPPPAPPAPRTDTVDGLYRGTSTRFQANTKGCPRPGLVTLQLWDRRFQYRWSYNTYVDAVILPDGSIEGQGPGISMRGKYEARTIRGDVTNGDCGLHFTVKLSDK